MKKRITKFIVETERVLIFRKRSGTRAGWCVACGAKVMMASVEEAARLARTSELVICRRIEADVLHFIEDAEGRVRVCLNSLRKAN
ncbi:MAG: hypothetical protein M3R15_08975 [Acidobacteriota bacterium]|nr:hypothetical protein [Acidobacteriota bacterium]